MLEIPIHCQWIISWMKISHVNYTKQPKETNNLLDHHWQSHSHRACCPSPHMAVGFPLPPSGIQLQHKDNPTCWQFWEYAEETNDAKLAALKPVPMLPFSIHTCKISFHNRLRKSPLCSYWITKGTVANLCSSSKQKNLLPATTISRILRGDAWEKAVATTFDDGEQQKQQPWTNLKRWRTRWLELNWSCLFSQSFAVSYRGFFEPEDLSLSWRKPGEQQLGHCHALGYQT